MVQWGVPEKILQNAVHFSFSLVDLFLLVAPDKILFDLFGLCARKISNMESLESPEQRRPLAEVRHTCPYFLYCAYYPVLPTFTF